MCFMGKEHSPDNPPNVLDKFRNFVRMPFEGFEKEINTITRKTEARI